MVTQRVENKKQPKYFQQSVASKGNLMPKQFANKRG